jgi:aryl sulfotransferase
VTAPPYRYTSSDEDSGRWDGFELRGGDVVISTRTKHGTTWMQNIVALLIFGTADLPAPIAELSPWLDWTTAPRDEVVARLDAQTHRRFIKTHTPLDGIPIDDRVTYIVVARHPLDAAVSSYHQQLNLDRGRWAELTGNAPPDLAQVTPPLHECLVAWIDMELDPREVLDSLDGVGWHVADAWDRRDEPNVLLVHYDELQRDLDAAMRRVATRLGIEVDEARWPELVAAAGFDAMRARAADAVPDRSGVVRSADRFFRRGVSGGRFEALSADEIAQYEARMATRVPPDARAWLHGEG